MVQATNLNKSYGTLNVLKNVNVNIKKGEIVSIVGQSGAGKTTLLQILGTLDNPDSGSLLINNIDVSSLNEKKMAKFRNQNIGFIFQFHHLLPEFTALENVCIPGFIGKKDEKTTIKKAKELLNLLGLEKRHDHKPNELSGGEQQRVAVARALINDPAIILADEPSGNLDTKTAKELHNLFFTLRDQLNQTFIIVTHNNELADMADRKLTMKDGEII
jgi:lipoprotein-releasing system ATP-binding protein